MLNGSNSYENLSYGRISKGEAESKMAQVDHDAFDMSHGFGGVDFVQIVVTRASTFSLKQ